MLKSTEPQWAIEARLIYFASENLTIKTMWSIIITVPAYSQSLLAIWVENIPTSFFDLYKGLAFSVFVLFCPTIKYKQLQCVIQNWVHN